MHDHVTVRFFAAARAAAGTAESVTAPGSVGEIMQTLTAEYPGLATVLPLCSFLVDGLVAKAPFTTAVAAGSTLDVLPPFAGG